jgi:hypothetical protein
MGRYDNAANEGAGVIKALTQNSGLSEAELISSFHRNLFPSTSLLEQQLARVPAKATIAEDIRCALHRWDGLT